MNEITLYPNWEHIDFKVWIHDEVERVITEVSDEILDLITHFDLNKIARPKMKKLYDANKPTEQELKQEEYKLIRCSDKITSKINRHLDKEISFSETDEGFELLDWKLWDHIVEVSKWVYEILLNWSEEKKQEQKEKIWKWINKKD